MTTTLQQQQEAIREAMTNQASKIWVQKGGSRPSPQQLQADPTWAALNDAASTISSIRINTESYEREIRRLKAEKLMVFETLRPFSVWAEERIKHKKDTDHAHTVAYGYNDIEIKVGDLEKLQTVLMRVY